MLIKAIALSAAAGLLITSAAQAQESYTDTTKVTQKGPQDTSATMSTHSMSADHSMSSTSSATVNPTYSTSYPATAATTYSTDVSTTYPASTDTLATSNSVQLVTNMPVADTPANRARYTPLSATGRRTAPRGN